MVGAVQSTTTAVRDGNHLSYGQRVRPPEDGCSARTSEISSEGCARMGSLIKKRRKKMSKHKYRKRLKANRHKRKR